MHRTSITLALAAFGIACSLFTAFALARDSHVNCNFKGDIGKIATVLSGTDEHCACQRILPREPGHQRIRPAVPYRRSRRSH
jgi:hypothetical protein